LVIINVLKALLGYRVHVAFKRYFDVISANVQRWHACGLILNLLESSTSLSSPHAYHTSSTDTLLVSASPTDPTHEAASDRTKVGSRIQKIGGPLSIQLGSLGNVRTLQISQWVKNAIGAWTIPRKVPDQLFVDPVFPNYAVLSPDRAA
jgi:hypothetical protein